MSIAQIGWKNYPVPNPAFTPGASGMQVFLARVSAVFLWVSWVLYGAGCVWTLIALPVTGNGRLAVNVGLWAAMLGWALLWFALPLYARSQARLMLALGEIIPAMTGPFRRPMWFRIMLAVPMAIAAIGTGMLGTIAFGIERGLGVLLSVEYVAGGKLRRRAMLVPRASNQQLWNEEVWVTRPRLFVPPRPVDRSGTLGVLDHCTLDAKDWLHHAFQRAISRADARRAIKRRAKAIARIRHDGGRGGEYN